MPRTPWVIVFSKAPEVGRVKTRLAAQVGTTRALQVYRGMAERQWGWLLASREEDGFRLAVSYDPPEAGPCMRAWLPQADAYLPQGAGNLGGRIASACAWALDEGASCVTVIGSDCPGFSRSELQRGFEASQHAPFTLGPATDGGFYALTLTPRSRSLLDLLPGIPWSSAQTSARLVQGAAALGLVGATLAELRDLDTLEDLIFYQAELEGRSGGTS
jgi:hypothetical protein